MVVNHWFHILALPRKPYLKSDKQLEKTNFLRHMQLIMTAFVANMSIIDFIKYSVSANFQGCCTCMHFV